jgi:hypothetical protein
MRGTDLIIGMQVLLVQLKNCLGLQLEARAEEEINKDSVLYDFLNKQIKKNYDFQRDLQNLLAGLGNANGHSDKDNMRNFILEKGMPVLDMERSSAKTFRNLKQHYLSIIESYRKILSFKALPIQVESIMLRHLVELQGITCFLIEHKLYILKVNEDSSAVA